MKTQRAKFFFPPAALNEPPLADYRVHDGARERSVVVGEARIARTALPAPVTITNLAELFALVASVGEMLAVEDTAAEAAHKIAEEKKRVERLAFEAKHEAERLEREKNKVAPL